MKLFSERTRRVRVQGFTLLETMIAMACLGIVLGSIYSLSTNLTRKQLEAKTEYELTMMARALLDEYVVTFPLMPTSGVYKDTWDWVIVENPQDVLEPTMHDHHFDFVAVSVHVKRRGSNQEAQEYYTVVARRGG